MRTQSSRRRTSKPESALELASLLEVGESRFSRGEKEIADLLKPEGTELFEEGDGLLSEAYLGSGRELLPHAAHRLPGRTGCDLRAVREDHVARAEEREVVRDAGSYGTGTGDDDSSHCSSALRSPSVKSRNGRRTSGPIGTPRLATTTLAAA